jgi:hypothetical protein
MMNKRSMLILISVMLSTILLIVYAQAAGSGANISTNETLSDQVTTTPADTIAINENISIINITKNSNETTVSETIIKEAQTKSSPGFSLTDTVISLISVIILIMVYKIGRNI